MRRKARPGRALLATAMAATVGLLGAGPAQGGTRGAGTMLVRQDVRCEGSGTTSTVHLPFALYFTGYHPHETGTVAAYTQPGNELIGSATITLDSQGDRCVEVVGEAPPGQYKIVYDFGSGTGKQKVIRLVEGPEGGSSPTAVPTSASATPTTSASPTTATASPTTTTASPTTTSASPTSTSASPTSTGASPTSTSTTPSTSPSGSPSPSATDPGHVEFIPEDLAPTGSGTVPAVPAAMLLLVLGGALVAATSRGGRAASPARRH